MSRLTDLNLAEARDGLVKGDFSSAELTSAYIDAMSAAQDLNAYITETPEIALERAKASDARRKAGEVAGPMDGIPVAVKDLFGTEGVLTTAASHILDGFKPTYESTVTANLRDGGAVMLGKTNLDEFAMGSANMTSYYGAVKNPWKGADGKDLVPGGSSGGSASAVAAQIAVAATGTDTGGSIRQPASFCGIVGMKPTYGRCSRWGVVAFASSLDQAGPLTRTVRDAAIMLGEMAGHDVKDSTSAPIAVPNFEAALSGDVKGLKVGIPKEYALDGMPDEIAKLWQQGADWLKAAGAETREISLPHTKYALPAYYIIAPAEASSNLARYDGVRYGLRVPGDTLDEMYENTRAEGFGDEVRRRILIGAYVLSVGFYDAYYLKAQRVRALIAQDFEKAFKDVDVILTPTAPSAAFGIGEKMDDPIAMYLNDVYTVPTSMAGLPGISIPGGLDGDGLPLGLHLIGKPFDEETMFRSAGVLEEAAGFTAKPGGA
ncbi:MAG: Asp-tRNA(Asn)/Glu-tRNA(Gln) amidotransferase subunit GatA [Rhodospirillaceae bacterium]|jgi:aspartyl-tRNA(Asn)/glutamyl-tRNA(Gln) amidotransferase subunit A|nr:Asp-tRNA(Asn)/Glu-tRNA(Gln) amidotransferase subunit GatA [Rhodospirillaceae bacterium]MBT7487905.1 Asp-tRNA(Asn)/Glu-tRNA(Gln) amidotransferase subunit GatA [Rhodospirillales bacterium]MBT4700196.1 Asp-tRNA(Asn)/Glu-tRNA(Gln) amidotransferase subunit GatA [Rhodospirillaceae bacterium]MBT5033066.1 Asp-tRNA(Asn)/Glu-tRNA(Gln) amidotransferase subunit GatA [Rhodospirillaceae bacterium]MBT6362380.1 Asp-tRNA(Asn)/Glu-tRNA(Gln) amidotransferase subunit GatA [Rhodospirillaceae bacterium]